MTDLELFLDELSDLISEFDFYNIDDDEKWINEIRHKRMTKVQAIDILNSTLEKTRKPELQFSSLLPAGNGQVNEDLEILIEEITKLL